MRTNIRAVSILLAMLCQMLPLSGAEEALKYSGAKLSELEAIIAKEPNKRIVVKFGEKEGFNANVNIQVQEFAGTMKDYIDVSYKEFDQLFNNKWTTPSEFRKGEREYLVEVVGTHSGREFHFYARAARLKDKIFLITATALNSQWNEIGEKLCKYVDSFVIE